MEVVTLLGEKGFDPENPIVQVKGITFAESIRISDFIHENFDKLFKERIKVAVCQHADGSIYTWLLGETLYKEGDFATAQHRNGARSFVKVLNIRELQEGEREPACKLLNHRERKERSKRSS